MERGGSCVCCSGWRADLGCTTQPTLRNTYKQNNCFMDIFWFKCNVILSGKRRKTVSLQVLLWFLTFFAFFYFFLLCFLICCFKDILLPTHQKQDGCVWVCVCVCARACAGLPVHTVKSFHLTSTTQEGKRSCHGNTPFRWLPGDNNRDRGIERWRLL